MTNFAKFTVRATAAAALLSLGGVAFAGTLDANIEFDNTYRSGSAVAEADKGLSQGGRVEFNAAGKAGANMFVAGRASFLAKKDGTAATDDMWVQIGSAKGDVKLGRFEATDLFPIVTDTLVDHATPAVGATGVYYNNDLRGRKGASVFHAAGTMNLAPGMSLEIGVVQTNNGIDAKGVRPVLSYAAGPLNASVGLESGKYASGNSLRGFGATVGYNFGAFKLTGNLANGKTDVASGPDKKSAFAVTVAAGGLAVGVIAATADNGSAQDKTQTGYVAYAMPLFDIKGATITPAISTSTFKPGSGADSTSETSARVRINYTF